MGTVEAAPARMGDGDFEEAKPAASGKPARPAEIAAGSGSATASPRKTNVTPAKPTATPAKPAAAKAAPVTPASESDEELEDAISFDEAATPEGEASDEGETQEGEETTAPFEAPTLPEGVELDAELLGKLAPRLAKAKEAGLDQGWFQGLVDDFTAHQQAMAEAAQSEVDTQYKAQQREWVDQVRQDEEWGGPRYAATRKLASVGFERLFGREAARAFQLTGLLNHPSVVIGCAKAGKLFSERPVVLGGVTNQEEDLSDEEVLFGGRK